MIEVEHLTKEFKLYKKYEGFRGALKALFTNESVIKRAVDDVSFSIKEGELVAYLGSNGAGKSTTIKMMTGLMVPTSGQCTVNGIVPYRERKEHTRNIGVVFGQRTQLWWDLPVSESFRILQKIYDIPQDKFKANLEFLKETLGLTEFYLVPVRNLSLGQKMRADLAASLLHDPKVLFLDEPTIGLDVLVKSKIREAIRLINKERNTTVVLTTHDLADIEEVCDRIIVIDSGHKIYDGSIQDLKDMFGKYRGIKLEVTDYRNIDLNHAFGLGEDALTKTENGNEILIKFRKEAIETSRLIGYIVENYSIRDITIQEPQLEDIVKEIYSGKISLELGQTKEEKVPYEVR